MSAKDVDSVIRAGLGPLFGHLLTDHPIFQSKDLANRLRASEMTARVMTADLLRNVAWTLNLLSDCGLSAILLKGISFANNYYPEPHLRTMGDVDFLLPAESIALAEKLLLGAGFEVYEPEIAIDYDEHLHSAPLYHPKRHLWIELHRRLLPDSFEASQELPLNLRSSDDLVEPTRILDGEAQRFKPEFELVYLASGWCSDMTIGFGPQYSRTVFDAVLLLRKTQGSLDWDKIIEWTAGKHAGVCLLILLSLLERIEVLEGTFGICEELMKSQTYVNPVSLKMMHNRVEKYLLRFEPHGRPFSAAATACVFATLLQPQPAWRNVLSVPGGVLFPPQNPRRFELGFQVRRIRNVMRRL